MPSNSDNAGQTDERQSWRSVRFWVRRSTIGLLLLGMLAGATGLLVAEEVDVRFSSERFCTSCHTMRETVFREYQESKHYQTATGVRASCSNCHVSKRLLPALWDHFLGSRMLITELTRDPSKPEWFEARRAAVAEGVRLQMLGDNSKNCRTCHVMAAIQPTKNRGQAQHREAVAKGNSNCIACHYNLVHKEVPVSDAFTKAAEKFQ